MTDNVVEFPKQEKEYVLTDIENQILKHVAVCVDNCVTNLSEDVYKMTGIEFDDEYSKELKVQILAVICTDLIEHWEEE